MSKPILPLPVSNLPEAVKTTSGEGAITALAAMIRKRKASENHVEPQSQPQPPDSVAPIP